MPRSSLNICEHAILICLLLVLSSSMPKPAQCAELQATTYIVHMDKSAMPSVFTNHEHWYKSLLSSVKGNGLEGGNGIDVEDMYVYVYDNVMHGFSAKLTEAQLNTLEGMPGHVLSFPDPAGTLDTTYSYEFLGLNSDSGVWPKARFGKDTIIGLVDTGIWPESKSFDDRGITEDVPLRWKGECELGTDFNSSLCNKKLIGARYFNKGILAKYGKIKHREYKSARDANGHGSHTSSTAAGNFVPHVDYFGYAPGTARGVAPAARIAMYKVIWFDYGMGSDVLAAMERAIQDGVDVLSLSLGFSESPYFRDVIAQGAFAAMERGVVVTCSAGNRGPMPRSVHNAAPWILTVGASTLDRDFVAALTLGDGSVFEGISFYGVSDNRNRTISGLQLVYPGSITGDKACSNKFDPEIVAGKAVLCISDDDLLARSAKKAKAAVLISVSETNPALAFPQYFFMPRAIVAAKDGAAIANYASSATNPVVDIEFEITLLGSKPAPAIAQFSSRGPSQWSPDILKPDLVAPGVNILAAWQPHLSLLGSLDRRRVNYNIASGTSMSCPHVAGLAALLKSVHPDWSPAAIRSALMTTSYTLDNSGHTLTDLGKFGTAATPLDFGAGHVDPNRAMDPGLVYDLGAQDYVNFLCSNTNYTSHQIYIITGTPVSCSGSTRLGTDNLNYPSFTARFNSSSSSIQQRKTFERMLTNVGDRLSSYKAVVKAPRGVTVRVNPGVLVFKEKLQKLNFTMSVELEEGKTAKDNRVRSGYLSWVDRSNHVVKSPLVIIFE